MNLRAGCPAAGWTPPRWPMCEARPEAPPARGWRRLRTHMRSQYAGPRLGRRCTIYVASLQLSVRRCIPASTIGRRCSTSTVEMSIARVRSRVIRRLAKQPINPAGKPVRVGVFDVRVGISGEVGICLPRHAQERRRLPFLLSSFFDAVGPRQDRAVRSNCSHLNEVSPWLAQSDHPRPLPLPATAQRPRVPRRLNLTPSLISRELSGAPVTLRGVRCSPR
jgi:hypothetical protein